MQNHTDPSQLKVVEGVEKGHSSHSTQAEIKAKLGFDPNTVAKQTINLDSQVKYCVFGKWTSRHLPQIASKRYIP